MSTHRDFIFAASAAGVPPKRLPSVRRGGVQRLVSPHEGVGDGGEDVLMAPKRLPKGENTAGLNPDGTLAIGTPDQMRPLLEQWKRWQEMYERGEIPDEPVLAVQPAATTR
jgi:hypothetical protein